MEMNTYMTEISLSRNFAREFERFRTTGVVLPSELLLAYEKLIHHYEKQMQESVQ